MNNNILKNISNTGLEIYQMVDGSIKVEVKVEEGSVWLTQAQISTIFNKDRSVITKHISKILKEEELDKAVCAKIAHTAADGKTYDTQYYNLDMIISVGYRVNSKQGIRFRKWASNILKEYLVKGYSINHEKVMQDKLRDLTQTVELLSNTLINQNLVTGTGIEILSLIKDYTKTWNVLIRYDEDRLDLPSNLHIITEQVITYNQAIEAIISLKEELTKTGDAGGLFGLERDKALESILGNIEQTYDGQNLYASVEEKAAHLLYFVIKDHPFSDGNKRIGSLLFLLYISNVGAKLRIPNANNMISLALLIAESNPSQKDVMIKLIINLITEEKNKKCLIAT